MNVINYKNFEEALKTEGQYVTPLSGNSMFPMVRHQKDPVLIVPADRLLNKYDVAVYARPGRYVVHRVLGQKPGYYIIRGDNCIAKEIVPEDSVVGVVDGFWRNGRYIQATNRWYLSYVRFWVCINPIVRIHHFIKKAVRFAWKESVRFCRLLTGHE